MKKPGFLDHPGMKIPELIDLKHDMSNSSDNTPRAKFGALSLWGAGLRMHEVVDHLCLFLHPLLYYLLAFLYRSQHLTDFRVLYPERCVFASSAFLICANRFFVFSCISHKNAENLHHGSGLSAIFVV